LKRLTFLTLFILQITASSFSQVISLEGRWKFHISDNEAWSKADFNDTGWESIHAPSAWEDEGFNGYNGFAWYRKKFDGKQLEKNENYYLNLGFIDDTDEVYVNGNLIGFSGTMPPKFKTAYNMERRYSLAPEIINYNGENTIAIRVYDVTLGGELLRVIWEFIVLLKIVCS
jgi:Beta-galactosidase/beta-glucuronidase